jgi:integrase
MSRRRKRPGRQRVGRVSYFLNHGAWYLYYRDGAFLNRVRVGQDEAEAASLAAKRNAELARGLVSPARVFDPITVSQLRQRFLDHHEYVVRSSLVTVNRYRTATAYLESFSACAGHSLPAHEIQADQFLRWLRGVQISPNGHAKSRQRPYESGAIGSFSTLKTLCAYDAFSALSLIKSERPRHGLPRRGNAGWKWTQCVRDAHVG